MQDVQQNTVLKRYLLVGLCSRGRMSRDRLDICLTCEIQCQICIVDK